LSSRKSTIKKSVHCINIPDDILSEKEVSYSHSSNVSSVACSESSLGKRNYNVLKVELKGFDDFMESYYGDQSDEQNEKDESSVEDEANRDANHNSAKSDNK
jgi:hypothetical protein